MGPTRRRDHMASELVAFARFLTGLPKLIRRRMTVAEAISIVHDRLRNRERNFLHLVEQSRFRAVLLVVYRRQHGCRPAGAAGASIALGSEQEATAFVLGALAQIDAGGAVARNTWRHAGTIRICREKPLMTGRAARRGWPNGLQRVDA